MPDLVNRHMLIGHMRNRRIPRTEIECGDPEGSKARHIRPAEFRLRCRTDGCDEVSGGRTIEPWPRGGGSVVHRDLETREDLAHMGDCLVNRSIRREAIVDGHDAFVGDHIARDTAGDVHGIEALAILESVDDRTPRLILTQALQDLTGRMHGVLAHPRTCTMRATTRCGHMHANRSLAARLDTGIRRLHENREIRREQLRLMVGEMLQAVELGRDLLALVEHVRDIACWRRDARSE